MEIMVSGNAKRFYSPDEVITKLNFYTLADNYLEKGVKDVENFIIDTLEKLNFKKENLKTNNFRIYEEKKFDYENKKEIKLGFAYTQSAVLKFDYSNEKVAKFMEKITKLKNPPKCSFEFGIKEEEKIRNEILAEAYLKAREKANVIAKAANKELKDCIKTDFKPFNSTSISNTHLDTAMFERGTEARMMKCTADNALSDVITNVFTPEDITIEENIYCLWITD